MDYFDVYGKLYDNGYRSKKKFTGGNFAMGLTAVLKYKSVLDVGCAKGEGLAWFTGHRKNATGVDPAEGAIIEAKRMGHRVKQASATDLPFPDRSFDLVFSSDVIEHLEGQEDVDKAMNEMLRVCKNYVALQIAIHPTKHRWTEVVDIPNIHSFLLTREEWRQYLEAREDCDMMFFGDIKHHVLTVLRRKDA